MPASKEAIEEWLNSPAYVSGWVDEGAPWRDWLKDVLFQFYADPSFGSKRPNCDSGWDAAFEMSLCLVNSKVFDVTKYRRLLVLQKKQNKNPDSEEFWEEIDDIQCSRPYPDSREAVRAFADVLDHLFSKEA